MSDAAALRQEFAAAIRKRAESLLLRGERDVLLTLAQLIAPKAANDNAPLSIQVDAQP